MEAVHIDIIIPVYNRAKLVLETITSIKHQTFVHWKCWIVDDGSNDGLDQTMQQIIQDDSRFHYVKRPDNRVKGPNACRNYGFEISNGKWVYWMDSDDLLKPNALSSYIKTFDDTTDVVIAPVEITEMETGAFIKQNRISSENLIVDYFNNKVSYFVCGPMWKRSFLEKQQELFDEYLGHHDEWDFNLRMIYQNPSKSLLMEPQVLYRQHKDSFKTEIPKGNHKQIESAFTARFKHLSLITEYRPDLQKKIKTLIAHLYKKTVRNFLTNKQKGWFMYYRSAVVMYTSMFDFKSILKMNIGIVSLLLTGKGYRWFS